MVTMKKNPTESEKQEIMQQIRNLLDRKDTPIYFQMSRELKDVSQPGEEVQTLEPTGAMSVTLSVVNSPAVFWAADIEEMKKEAR